MPNQNKTVAHASVWHLYMFTRYSIRDGLVVARQQQGNKYYLYNKTTN